MANNNSSQINQNQIQSVPVPVQNPILNQSPMLNQIKDAPNTTSIDAKVLASLVNTVSPATLSLSQSQSNDGNFLHPTFNINQSSNAAPLLHGNTTNQTSPNYKYSADPQIPSEYLNEIYHNLIAEETHTAPDPQYMRIQDDINEKMRAILVDWLIEVHLKFKLLSETLFLTINIIDRYLSKKPLARSKLQLLGVTSLLIACKYEEIYAPDIRDFVYITDRAFSKEEILIMEIDVLKSLEFNVTISSSYKFFELIFLYFNLPEKDICLGRFLLEIFLLDNRINKYNPSLVACTVVYMVMKMKKYENYHDVYKFTSFGEIQLKECVKDICFLVDNIANSSLQSVRTKFGTKEMYEVSKTKLC